ncbi:hypothetical protein ABPG72_012696 [Tetrahymena utriculariae]
MENQDQKQEFKLKSKYLNAKKEEIKIQEQEQKLDNNFYKIQTKDLIHTIFNNSIKFIIFSGGAIFLRSNILQRFVYKQQSEKWAFYIYQYERGQLGQKLIQPKLHYNHYIFPFLTYYMIDIGVATFYESLIPKQSQLQSYLSLSIMKSLNLSFCCALFVSRNPKVLCASLILGNTLFLTNMYVKDFVSDYF